MVTPSFLLVEIASATPSYVFVMSINLSVNILMSASVSTLNSHAHISKSNHFK